MRGESAVDVRLSATASVAASAWRSSGWPSLRTPGARCAESGLLALAARGWGVRQAYASWRYGAVWGGARQGVLPRLAAPRRAAPRRCQIQGTAVRNRNSCALRRAAVAVGVLRLVGCPPRPAPPIGLPWAAQCGPAAATTYPRTSTSARRPRGCWGCRCPAGWPPTGPAPGASGRAVRTTRHSLWSSWLCLLCLKALGRVAAWGLGVARGLGSHWGSHWLACHGAALDAACHGGAEHGHLSAPASERDCRRRLGSDPRPRPTAGTAAPLTRECDQRHGTRGPAWRGVGPAEPGRAAGAACLQGGGGAAERPAIVMGPRARATPPAPFPSPSTAARWPGRHSAPLGTGTPSSFPLASADSENSSVAFQNGRRWCELLLGIRRSPRRRGWSHKGAERFSTPQPLGEGVTVKQTGQGLL